MSEHHISSDALNAAASLHQDLLCRWLESVAPKIDCDVNPAITELQSVLSSLTMIAGQNIAARPAVVFLVREV